MSSGIFRISVAAPVPALTLNRSSSFSLSSAQPGHCKQQQCARRPREYSFLHESLLEIDIAAVKPSPQAPRRLVSTLNS